VKDSKSRFLFLDDPILGDSLCLLASFGYFFFSKKIGPCALVFPRLFCGATSETPEKIPGVSFPHFFSCYFFFLEGGVFPATFRKDVYLDSFNIRRYFFSGDSLS